MRKCVLLSILYLSSMGFAMAGQNYSYQTVPVMNSVNRESNIHTLKYSVVTVPAGETFRAVTMMPISSETAYTGQQILLALNSDFYFNGKVVAPVGSALTGTVIDVSKAKHGSLDGKLSIRFTHLIMPDGLDVPISAVIKTDDNKGVLIGGNEVEDVVASETGKPKRLSVSSLTGSGGGLVKSIWDKGNDVNIPVNATVELILIQPITVNH